MERLNGEVRDREKVMRGLKIANTSVLPVCIAAPCVDVKNFNGKIIGTDSSGTAFMTGGDITFERESIVNLERCMY